MEESLLVRLWTPSTSASQHYRQMPNDILLRACKPRNYLVPQGRYLVALER